MSRKTLIRSADLPYHVTARVNNRQVYPGNLRDSWSIHLNQLAEAEEDSSAKVHAFVMMDNHFHLLISTPGDDLGRVMMNYMRSVTKIMNVKTGRSGRIFGGRYHWSLIDSMDYFDCALKYVYRNPVKAKMTPTVESYFYSTLNTQLGEGKLPFELHPPPGESNLIPNQNPDEFLEWLNEPFLSEQEQEITLAMRKTTFKPFLKKYRGRQVPGIRLLVRR